jgi:hypothetical protein
LSAYVGVKDPEIAKLCESTSEAGELPASVSWLLASSSNGFLVTSRIIALKVRDNLGAFSLAPHSLIVQNIELNNSSS